MCVKHINGEESLAILPCRCLLTKRNVEESQLLIAAIPKMATTRKTWEEIMEVLAWSWGVLFAGACPKKDKDGGPMEKNKGKKTEKRDPVVHHRGFRLVC